MSFTLGCAKPATYCSGGGFAANGQASAWTDVAVRHIPRKKLCAKYCSGYIDAFLAP
jgi:hypothetical protein